MKQTIPADAGLHPDPEKQYYDAREFLLIPDDSQFVTSAYACILKRVPDAEGFNGYCDGLSKGGYRQQVLVDLLLSEEGCRHGVILTHLGTFLALTRFRRRSPRRSRWLAPGLRLAESGLNRFQHYQARQLRPRFFREQALQEAMQNTRQDVLPVIDRIDTLEQQNAALRSRLYLLERGSSGAANGQEPAPAPDVPDAWPAVSPEKMQQQRAKDFSNFYLEFEIAFRGSREAIHERLLYYLAFLPPAKPVPPKVVDLGCGRGQWLFMLEEAGYEAQGLDSSPVMLEICREKGLNVSDKPIHDWLCSQPDASLGAITAFHIAEHLPFDYLLAIVREAKRLLQPGGMLMIETQNPESLRVSAYAFYHDPTHRNPLTPELLEFTAHYAGFREVHLQRLSEMPLALQIAETTETAAAFNRLLNAPRDLALIAVQSHDNGKTA